MHVTLRNLKVGDVFQYDEGEGIEELEVTEPPATRGFSTFVPVKSLNDGFEFRHAGHPDHPRQVVRRKS